MLPVAVGFFAVTAAQVYKIRENREKTAVQREERSRELQEALKRRKEEREGM